VIEAPMCFTIQHEQKKYIVLIFRSSTLKPRIYSAKYILSAEERNSFRFSTTWGWV